jgi:polysaccharide pyruvyl transferase WcaK-like protein
LSIMGKPGERIAGVVGPYRFRNFGDDLIGLVIARHLRGLGFGEVWMHDIAEQNAAFAGATVRRLRRIVLEADHVVIGGGHLLGDGGYAPTVYYQKLLFLTALFRWALGRPTEVNGVGAGPLALRGARFYAKLGCRLVRRVGVRDPESVRFVARELGCAESKIMEGADLALLWPELFPMRVRPEMRRAVGIQMDWLGENPGKMKVPGGIIDKWSGDVIYLSNGRKTTRAKNLFGIPGIEANYESMPGFLELLSQCRTVITTHLHIAIAAYAARIPTFTLAMNRKSRRFYAQVGHPERCIDLEDFKGREAEAMREVLRRATDGCEWSSEDEERLEALRGKARRLVAGIGS